MKIIIMQKVKYRYKILKYMTITSLFIFGTDIFNMLKNENQNMVSILSSSLLLWWSFFYTECLIGTDTMVCLVFEMGTSLAVLFIWVTAVTSLCMFTKWLLKNTRLRKRRLCESMLIFAALKWTQSSQMGFLQRSLNSWQCMIKVSQFP